MRRGFEVNLWIYRHCRFQEKMQEKLVAKYLQIAAVVSGYWVISIFTVFVNKRLLSHTGLETPMVIALYQTLITALICFIMKCMSRIAPNQFTFPKSSDVCSLQTIREVLPLSFVFTCMIASNNLCLKYVTVAFYYIGRSLTTIFNVIFTYFILKQKTSKRCILCCIAIIFGFSLGVDQENLAGSLSISGTIFGVLGSLSLSLYSIYTKKVLPLVDDNIWLLSYYNNVYASVLLFILVILNGELTEVVGYPQILELHFWTIMTIGGVCGFAIGFFTSLQIKYTSALTHNISGTAKACAQTVLATFWYEESKSAMWWLSNSIVLVSSASYARIKQLDMEKQIRENVVYEKV